MTLNVKNVVGVVVRLMAIQFTRVEGCCIQI